MSFGLLQAQNQNVIVSKVTATWCGLCGNWGWDYTEALKEAYPSGPATVMTVHKSGSDLENATSTWFLNNLNVGGGQPLFYINNDQNLVGSGSWSNNLEDTKQEIEALADGFPVISFDGVSLAGDQVECTVQMELNTVADGTEYTIAVYVLENNVVNFQSGQGADAVHTNVMRMSLGQPEGINAIPLSAHEFSDVVDPDWNKDELGLLAVLYEVDGDDYKIIGSTAVANFASKTNTQDLLDPSIFTYSDEGGELVIIANDNNQYGLTINDMSGKQITSTDFSGSVRIAKNNTPTGVYVMTFSTENKTVSQQIFIK